MNLLILKILLVFIFVSDSFFNKSFAQEHSKSMEAWQELLNKPELADYFSDIFTNLGIEVEETIEKFTVHHKGDHFTLSQGINKDEVDYSVKIKLENVRNMASHGKDDKISTEESYRILSVLFTPLTEASLKMPMMSKSLMRRIAGIENHIHVYLMSSNGKEINAHTLVYLNKKWMVIEGIYGDALRTFKMSPDQALDYQRHVFVAMNKNTTKEWRKFKKWYIDWRKDVSIANVY